MSCVDCLFRRTIVGGGSVSGSPRLVAASHTHAPRVPRVSAALAICTSYTGMHDCVFNFIYNLLLYYNIIIIIILFI